MNFCRTTECSVFFNQGNRSQAKTLGGLFRKTKTVQRESQFFSRARNSGIPIDNNRNHRTATGCCLQDWRQRFGTGKQLKNKVFSEGISLYSRRLQGFGPFPVSVPAEESWRGEYTEGKAPAIALIKTQLWTEKPLTRALKINKTP